MASDVQKQFEEIEQFIIHGNFKEALSVIDEGLKKKNISKEKELSFLIYKGEIAFYLGNLQETLQLAELVLKESKGLANVLHQLDALILITMNSFMAGKLSKGFENAEKGLEIISSATNLPAKARIKRKAQLLHWKAHLFTQLGDFERSLELAKKALLLAEESGYKNTISHILIVIGEDYLFLDEIKKGEEYIEKAAAIATELGNKFYIAFSYVYLARVKIYRREYEQALDFFNKIFDFAEEIGSTLFLISKNDVGFVYLAMFQLDKALECFLESLKYAGFVKYIAYANIGYIYFLKYELEQAQKYYLKSMKICEEINVRRVLPMVLFNLILVSLELNQFTQAQKYLERLGQISNETGFERIDQVYRFASIMVLKASANISDLVQAAELLQAFSAEDDLSSFLRLDVLYALLEIRIKELQLTTNKNTLTMVKKQAIRLEVEAEEQQQLYLLVNVYRLQSQLALIELDAKKAIELLQKAQTIAEEINIELLMKKIKEDQEKIEQQLSMWYKLHEEKAPFSETVKLISLENSLKNIKQETILEERDKQTGKIIEFRKLFVLKL